VDRSHLGTQSDGEGEFNLWGFTITVGYSRRLFASATNQKLGTLLRMHESAFYEWGAVPDDILYDRMKTVWTGMDIEGGRAKQVKID
jgi:transposase